MLDTGIFHDRKFLHMFVLCCDLILKSLLLIEESRTFSCANNRVNYLIVEPIYSYPKH